MSNIVCPHCSLEMAVVASSIGTEVNCPVCENDFTAQPHVQSQLAYTGQNNGQVAKQYSLKPLSVPKRQSPSLVAPVGHQAQMSSRAVHPPVSVTAECPFCLEQIKPGARLCKHCGESIDHTQRNLAYQSRAVRARQHNTFRPPVSRTAYIVCALFLGGLGIHNFIARRTGIAVAQLVLGLLTIGLVSGLWALVEIITVKEDGDGVPFC